MHDVLNPWANPVTYAVPFFLLFIGIEFAALKWLDHDDNRTSAQRQCRRGRWPVLSDPVPHG